MSGRRAAREDVNGVLLAVASTALAVAAHGVGGGAVSDSGFSVLLATLLAWGGTSLARRGGTAGLVAVLGVTQLCQHVLLNDLASGHRNAPAAFDASTMVAAHAVATLATAVLLTRAGVALAAVTAALVWLVGRLHALVAPPVPARQPGTADPLPARPGLVLEVLFRQVCTRRGPPLHS